MGKPQLLLVVMWVAHEIWKVVFELLSEKLKTHMPYDLAIPFLGIIHKESLSIGIPGYKNKSIYNSWGHKKENLEILSTLINNKWRNKLWYRHTMARYQIIKINYIYVQEGG